VGRCRRGMAARKGHPFPTPGVIHGMSREYHTGAGKPEPGLTGVVMGTRQVCVRTEGITISGGLVRQKMKFQRFLRLRHCSNPKKGPIHYRSPARIFWRTVRGCAINPSRYPERILS
jgi:hypothetical protein